MNVNSEETALFRPLASVFHGASPTSFYCGNSLFHLMDLKKKEQVETSNQKKIETFPKEQESMETDYESEEEEHPSGYSRLHISACLGEKDQVEQFVESTVEISEINQQDRNGNTPLMWASFEGKSEVVQILVDNGAALNLQNFRGETSLFLAASRGNVDVCRILLENGANQNLGNIEATSPGHIAAVGGFVDILRLLNQYGAFMNAQDEEGDSILHYAIRESQEKIVEYLVLHAKACLSITNDDLETPLEMASCLGETRMVDFLSLYSGKETEHEGTFAMSL